MVKRGRLSNRRTKLNQLSGTTSNYTHNPIYVLTQVAQGALDHGELEPWEAVQ